MPSESKRIDRLEKSFKEIMEALYDQSLGMQQKADHIIEKVEDLKEDIRRLGCTVKKSQGK